MDISNRNVLVFDIETIGDSIDDYPQDIQEYLTKSADTDEKKLELIQEFGLNPLTGKIAALGLMDNKKDKGCILVNCEEDTQLCNNHKNFTYLKGDEKFIITKFWEIVVKGGYNVFVTFNGRDFDCPFIMLRSLFHKIKPPVNLMKGSDYTSRDNHVDLMKEFNFYAYSSKGGARRKFNLHFYCNKFGIKSPKADGYSGNIVAQLVEEKRYQELADYCIGDVVAENQLFCFWNEYFNI
ncbi:MAG: 3'-5' exonuclease [Ignavibacteriae bacterium]|nr:MAG: 3'-5' exonuclease [Ignavibacteriota bacterium]